MNGPYDRECQSSLGTLKEVQAIRAFAEDIKDF